MAAMAICLVVSALITLLKSGLKEKTEPDIRECKSTLLTSEKYKDPTLFVSISRFFTLSSCLRNVVSNE